MCLNVFCVFLYFCVVFVFLCAGVLQACTFNMNLCLLISCGCSFSQIVFVFLCVSSVCVVFFLFGFFFHRVLFFCLVLFF